MQSSGHERREEIVGRLSSTPICDGSNCAFHRPSFYFILIICHMDAPKGRDALCRAR